jgi:predicted flap endonuclease-1-like 5' DNA nuclease
MGETGWIILLAAAAAAILIFWLIRGRKQPPQADTPMPRSEPAPVEPAKAETAQPPQEFPSAPAFVGADGEADDLLRLKGVGPKIDAQLGNFAGRPRRDNWVDQARLLAAGDLAGYEAKYGKL